MSTPERDDELRLVARCFSAVGHELAGPLQTALNALFVLERRCAAVPPELLGPVKNLEQAVEALRQRLDHLLRLPQALHPLRGPTSGELIVAQALEAVGPGARRVVLASKTPNETVELDERGVVTALTELLLNALEAAGAEATVTLRATLEVGALIFTVENPGGRWPEPMEAAVDPFVTSRPRTLGLGLSIARAVALAHGGDLALSRQGETSLVMLSVPKAAPP